MLFVFRQIKKQTVTGALKLFRLFHENLPQICMSFGNNWVYFCYDQTNRLGTNRVPVACSAIYEIVKFMYLAESCRGFFSSFRADIIDN